MSETTFSPPQFDEETLKAIRQAIEHAIEVFQQLQRAVSEIAGALFGSPEIAEIANLISGAEREIERRRAERAKWRNSNSYLPKPPMLDKRPQIHRCRNAI